MSLFGKILAVLNVFAVIGALAVLGMDYAKRRTWEYAVFRQDLMIKGLPLDDEETDDQGRPFAERIGKQTQTELFSGREPVTTQVAEVKRIQSNLSSKITAAGDKKKQIYLYSRVLLPLSLTNEQRQRMIAYQTYLKDDNTYKNLLKLLTEANRVATQPPEKDRRPKPYDEAFSDTLALQYTDPLGPLAEAFLAVKKANPATPVDQALEQSLDPQLTQLQGQFDQAFQEALKIQPKKDNVKSDPPSERKRIIAHLLFNLVDALPDDAAGAAAPKPDLATNEGYKRWLIVVGVRAAATAVNDEAALLRDMAAEVAVQRQRELSIYAVEHRKLTDLVVDQASRVEMDNLLLARKQKELAAHEEDLKRRRQDVKVYQDQLAELREETTKNLKDLRGMSDMLYKKRVELRDDTIENQKREKKIRNLEYGRE